MNINYFGTTAQGEKVSSITLTNSNNMKAVVLNYGATLQSLFVEDGFGDFRDVVHGYDTIGGYEKGNCYFGATVGRHANRMKNASFVIDDVEYKVTANEGKNQLHGGFCGFDKKIFEMIPVSESKASFTYRSADGEEGFPGCLTLHVSYEVTEDNELVIEYDASVDKPTIANFTNHSYFNLAGHNSGSALNHILQIKSNWFTPVGDNAIPTGEIIPVINTPFDFNVAKVIAKDIEEDNLQLRKAKGYDHNFVIDKKMGYYGYAAALACPESGIVMKVYTTEPGIQLYTANYVGNDKTPGKDGAVYRDRSAVCLETQHFPASNVHKHFPSIILRPGVGKHEKTVHAFSIASKK